MMLSDGFICIQVPMDQSIKQLQFFKVAMSIQKTGHTSLKLDLFF